MPRSLDEPNVVTEDGAPKANPPASEKVVPVAAAMPLAPLTMILLPSVIVPPGVVEERNVPPEIATSPVPSALSFAIESVPALIVVPPP
jgi:hypothetical protein